MPSHQAYDFEIQKADGTWLGLMLAVQRGEDGDPIEGAPKTLNEILAASDDELPISKRLIPRIMEDWSGGMGNAYNAAPGVYTRTPGYALPAGQPTAMTLTAANNSNSPIVKIATFGSDLFMAQEGNGAANEARVLRSTDQGVTWTNSLNLPASQYVNDLLTFNDPTSTLYTTRLYASSSDARHGGGNGRLHKWDGTSWTSTTLGDYTLGAVAYARHRMAKVFWTDNEGIGAWRMVAISGGRTISYTIPEGDPMDDSATAWVEGVVVGSGALRIGGSARHIFVSAAENVYDINELGDSIPLTSYWPSLLHGANGLTLQYHDGYLYSTLGQGLDRIKVDEGSIRQDNVGLCAPGWGTPAESVWSGWTTELAVDQGFLVNAMHNPRTGQTGIFWGKDKNILGIESRNPLIWYGPEVTLGGGYKVTAMLPVARAEDELALFFAASKGGDLEEGTIVYRVSLPVAGSPIQDLASAGKHRYATGAGTGDVTPLCELELLDEGWDDRASMKFLHEHTVVSRGLSIKDGVNDGFGTKLTFYDRADPAPGNTTWASSTDVTEWPAQTVMPATVVEGHRIGRKIRFTSPKGAEALAANVRVPVLDAVRTTAWRSVPFFKVFSATVEYGAGVVNRANTTDTRDPDDVTTDLYTLSRAGRTVLRDGRGRRYTCKVEQLANAEATLHDEPPHKTVKCQIEITIISVLAP